MNQVAIIHGGERIETTTDKFNETCEALIAKYGPGVPKVETLTTEDDALEARRVEAIAKHDATMARVTPEVVRGVTISTEGKLRSMLDKAGAIEMGFAPAETLYERGTMVVDLGVENARASRVEHEAKPTVASYCADLINKVHAEERRDTVITASALRMTTSGKLAHPSQGDDRLLLEERAFGSLVTRLGFGGAEYLRKCSPKLRAINVNNWMAEQEAKETDAEIPMSARPTVNLRTRNTRAGRAAFAVTSESYTAFDVDKIAEALALAAPPEARGTVAYDGYKAQFEVMFHSNVQPENYVAGEFFKSGIIARTDDTGGGSIVISAAVWQNLCLNLIIIDQNEQVTARIRHIGDVQKLAAKFRQGFEVAQGKLDYFLRAWGYAAQENVVEMAKKSDPTTVSMMDAEIFMGLLRGTVERELVPVRGNVEQAVKALKYAWEQDDSSATKATPYSRAAVANAFTRYAHETNTDPFFASEIESAAGALIYSKQPLPFVAKAA